MSEINEMFEESVISPIQVIEEATDTQGPKKVWFEAVVSTADIVNRNGRLYPQSILFPAFEELNAQIQSWKEAGFSGAPGAVDHPDGVPSMSHNGISWDNFRFEGSNVIGKGFVVETARGKDLAAQLQAKLPVGFSTRGVGAAENVREGNNTFKRMTKFRLTTVDAVTDPSVFNARVSNVTLESTQEEDNRMEQLEEALAKVSQLETDKVTLEAARDKALEAASEAQEALTEAQKQLEETNATLAEVKAKLDAIEAKEALDAKLNDLTKATPFAAAVIAEAKEFGVTIESAERLIPRLIKLVETRAAAANSGGGNSDAEEEAPADEQNEDAGYTLAQLDEALASRSISKRKYEDLKKTIRK